MTRHPNPSPEDADVAAVRENSSPIHVIAKNEGFTNIEGFADKGKAALDRLTERLQGQGSYMQLRERCDDVERELAEVRVLLQEAERERDANWAEAATNAAKWKTAEAREAALREALRRFMEWDALTALPDPLPAPFGDLHYWLAEFRSALATADPGAGE